MTGFMADFEADLAMPHGLSKKAGGSQIIALYGWTSPGTYTLTVPNLPGVTAFDLYVRGPGGGGGGGNGGTTGAGGGGGADDLWPNAAILPGQVLTIFLPSVQGGGNGSNTSNSGTLSGTSTIKNAAGTILVQGNGGFLAQDSGAAIGGLGGAAVTTPGHLSIAGGQGGNQGAGTAQPGFPGKSAGGIGTPGANSSSYGNIPGPGGGGAGGSQIYFPGFGGDAPYGSSTQQIGLYGNGGAGGGYYGGGYAGGSGIAAIILRSS